MTIELPTAQNPVVVLEGDSTGILSELPDAFCDHIITDPPYGEKTHAGARTRIRLCLNENLIDFSSISDDTFLVMCGQSVRVAKRWSIMTCDLRHAVAAEAAMTESVVRVGVWIKPDAAPQFTGDRPGTGWEAVLILHRPGRKKWNNGGHHAVWTNPVERNNVHRTQKPLALVRRWFREFTDPGDLVIDPFAGSGTTGVAAILEGRRAILIEKDARYAAIARERIAKALCREPGNLMAFAKQDTLFATTSHTEKRT